MYDKSDVFFPIQFDNIYVVMLCWYIKTVMKINVRNKTKITNVFNDSNYPIIDHNIIEEYFF